MSARIYVVTEMKAGGVIDAHLVRASSQGQAVRHVVAERFVAEVASQDELVTLIAGGAKVEDAAA